MKVKVSIETKDGIKKELESSWNIVDEVRLKEFFNVNMEEEIISLIFENISLLLIKSKISLTSLKSIIFEEEKENV